MHAINVLDMIFADRDLSAEVELFIVNAIEIMLDGYKSQRYQISANFIDIISWAVRNSATMMFSSLVERVVKPKSSRDDHSKVNGTTFKEFFGRYASLHGFFLNHLQQCLDYEKKTEVEHLSTI